MTTPGSVRVVGLVSAFLILGLAGMAGLDDELGHQDECETWKPEDPAAVAVLLDATDSVSSDERRRIRTYFAQQLDSLPAGSMTRAGFVTDGESRGAFSGEMHHLHPCGSPNPRRTRIAWNQRVDDILRRFDRTIASAEPWPRSDIMGAIESAGLDLAELSNDMRGAGVRKLVIFSDFLHNVDFVVPGTVFDQCGPPCDTRMAPELKGAMVVAYQLYVPPQVDREALKEFWDNYFKANEVADVKWDAIAG